MGPGNLWQSQTSRSLNLNSQDQIQLVVEKNQLETSSYFAILKLFNQPVYSILIESFFSSCKQSVNNHP